MTGFSGVSGESIDRGEVTRLLGALRQGDREAFDRIWELLYLELRRMASNQLRARGGTLDTSALVHEAYLKLVQADRIDLRDRSHFFALAAKVMRELVVDFARRSRAKKRGGEMMRVTFDESLSSMEREAEMILALDAALDRLAGRSERWSRVFEMRYFGGLSEQEVAEALETSLRTVQRDWLKSRAWLRRELEEG
ncbi:MAG: ECF-type sigma factor [Acidobacteriota bacterium]